MATSGKLRIQTHEIGEPDAPHTAIHELGEDGKPKRETKEMLFPILAPKELLPGQTLDQLEAETVTIGYQVLREMMNWRIKQLDAEISAERKHEAAECEVIYDGKRSCRLLRW